MLKFGSIILTEKLQSLDKTRKYRFMNNNEVGHQLYLFGGIATIYIYVRGICMYAGEMWREIYNRI